MLCKQCVCILMIWLVLWTLMIRVWWSLCRRSCLRRCRKQFLLNNVRIGRLSRVFVRLLLVVLLGLLVLLLLGPIFLTVCLVLSLLWRCLRMLRRRIGIGLLGVRCILSRFRMRGRWVLCCLTRFRLVVLLRILLHATKHLCRMV